MLDQHHGRIVNIASIAAVSGGRPNRSATEYAAAKAWVTMVSPGLTSLLTS